MTIYVNLEGGEAWTDEELHEGYELDLVNYPDATGTYEEWFEEQRDLGLLEVSINEYLDEILADDTGA